MADGFSSMELDAPAAASTATTATAPAAAPARSGRFKPKPKGTAKPPKPEPVEPAATNTEPVEPAATNPDPVVLVASKPDPAPMQTDMEVEPDQVVANEEEMVAADDDWVEEDVVIREIDVFLDPSIEEGALLYLMQYPLRPSWRPYELDDNCEEVRLKPKQSIVEVDMSLSVDNGNDRYSHEPTGSRTQVLSSAMVSPPSNFAIGIIKGNQLHLNPLQAVVQLRPLFTHLCTGVQKRKQIANTKANYQKSEGSITPSNGKGKPLEDSSDGLDNIEPWVPLKYHSLESTLSRKYLSKMMREKDGNIEFNMKSSGYIRCLCPGTSSSKKRSTGISTRDIKLPLNERLIKWFSEGHHINRFTALLHLDTTASIEDELLKILPLYAYLVQGLWVPKSSLLMKGFDVNVRDYIILLFSKNRIIRYDKTPPPFTARSILNELGIHREMCHDWKFREETDTSFIKAYPDIVKEQEDMWSNRERDLLEFLHQSFKTMDEKKNVAYLKNSLNPKVVKKGKSSGKSSPSEKKDTSTGASSRELARVTVASDDDIVKVLSEIFSLGSVRSMNSITRQLNAKGIISPPELKPFLDNIADNVHGVYISKSFGNREINELRTVIVKLFKESLPNSEFMKADIEEFVGKYLKRHIPGAHYLQVTGKLCDRLPNRAFVIKNGDS